MSRKKVPQHVTIGRIVRVNHAGETGAINIYSSQILVAKILYPDIVPVLQQMRQDEVRHCLLFREAMQLRKTRPCRIMSLWVLGGYVLGLVTALGGRNMIWICTEAVEATVHRHLLHQMNFLEGRDNDLKRIIEDIQGEEVAHLNHAIENQNRKGSLGQAISAIIGWITKSIIFLSTWGDPLWMEDEISRADLPE